MRRLCAAFALLLACTAAASARRLVQNTDCPPTALASLPDASVAVGLIDTLVPGGIPSGATLFLPSNAALASVLRLGNTSQPDSLSVEYQDKLRAVLLYHVAPGGVLTAEALAAAGAVSSALPGAAPLRAAAGASAGGLSLTDATGSTAATSGTPVQACSSTAFLLDNVLLPAAPLDPAFPSVASTGGTFAPTASGTSVLPDAAGTPAAAPTPAMEAPAAAGGPASQPAATLPSGTTAGAAAADGFDYLLLARQWGPGYCTTTSCSRPSYNLFGIHGLWPNSLNGAHPADCAAGGAYSEAGLTAAEASQAACEWTSLKGDDVSFREHEWEKHGTCAPSLWTNSSAYLATTMALSRAYDLNAAAEAAGIDLSSAGPVVVSDLTAALKEAWGVEVHVSCSNDVLLEVYLCFSPELKPIDCPDSAGSSCKASRSLALPSGSAALPEACAAAAA